MEAFSPELLTILALISISWAGVTCILVIVLLIIYICSLCSRRRQSKLINPTQSRRTSSSVSIRHHASPITSLPIKNPEQQKHYYDTSTAVNEHSYPSSYNNTNKNQYQQQDYMRDEKNETTTINDTRTNGQRHPKRHYQPLKPMTDIRINDRGTPYPPDVLARERLMNNSRYPSDHKY